MDWQRIYLVGAQEETDELENAMNKPVEDKVNKNLLNHEETKCNRRSCICLTRLIPMQNECIGIFLFLLTDLMITFKQNI